MPRSDYRIEKGQKLSTAISAAGWNRTQEAADIVLNTRGGQAAGDPRDFERAPNLILIKNTTNSVVPRFGVLAINSVEIDPTGGTPAGTDNASVRGREFSRRPVLRGVTPAGNSSRFCVTIEPISANGFGRAAVSGVMAVKIKLPTSGQFFYAVTRDGDKTQLLGASCGPVRLLWHETGPGDDKWAVALLS
jgi:hypothetical protein